MNCASPARRKTARCASRLTRPRSWETSEDRLARSPELFELADAARREHRIAHGERLIHHENIRVNMDGSGEGNAYVHAAGVFTNGTIDEISDIGKGSDVGECSVGLPTRQPHHVGRNVDIFTSSEIRIEARAEFQKAGNLSGAEHASCSRLQNAADDLQQCALA